MSENEVQDKQLKENQVAVYIIDQRLYFTNINPQQSIRKESLEINKKIPTTKGKMGKGIETSQEINYSYL